MWTGIILGIFLIWLFSVGNRRRKAEDLTTQSWFEARLSALSLVDTWDRYQLNRLVEVHNRRVNEHHAKSMRQFQKLRNSRGIMRDETEDKKSLTGNKAKKKASKDKTHRWLFGLAILVVLILWGLSFWLNQPIFAIFSVGLITFFGLSTSTPNKSVNIIGLMIAIIIAVLLSTRGQICEMPCLAKFSKTRHFVRTSQTNVFKEKSSRCRQSAFVLTWSARTIFATLLPKSSQAIRPASRTTKPSEASES